MKIEIKNQKVADVFNQHPKLMRNKLLFLRQLILEVVSENDNLEGVEETLKWGEPSYLTKNGSTIRVNIKSASTNEYAMYFNCKSKLVDTFKEIYQKTFIYEGNRAIVFNADEEIPVEELKHCILLSLTYHKIKHLPLLGA